MKILIGGMMATAATTISTKAIPQKDLETIYKEHYRRIYSLCLRMLGNTYEAEDLTHDVFIQISRKIASFRGEAALSTWIHRLTVNQVLMHLRKRRVRSERTTDKPDQIFELIEQRPQRSLFIGDRLEVDHLRLQAAMAELPPGYFKIFTMHDIQGYEHDEIATILGCSSGTSKSQLHKARLKLRRLLSKEIPANN